MDDLDSGLTRLLQRAVDDVEPEDRLAAIQERTEQAPGWRGWWIAGGTALATAAAVTAVALAQTEQPVDTAPGPAQTPTQSPTPAPTRAPTQTPSESVSPDAAETPEPAPSPTPSQTPSTAPSPAPTTGSSAPAGPVQSLAIPVYFPGQGPDGLRLFREWHRVDTSDELSTAALLAVSQSPNDPDYQQAWPQGTEATAEWDGNVITVDISTSGVAEDLRSGWGELDSETAEMMVQQLIFTVQAALGEGRVPVRLLLDGSHTDQVLGVPASEELANAPVLETLSLISLDDPAQGSVVDDGTLEVTGVASSFEANVLYRLASSERNAVVAEGNFTATGWAGDKLFPFNGTVDVSDVEPGRYVLTAMTDDPSSGEGIGAFSDDRVITIE